MAVDGAVQASPVCKSVRVPRPSAKVREGLDHGRESEDNDCHDDDEP